MGKSFSKLISCQIRFGYGYEEINNEIVYYAWHGLPNRNDDYITVSKITKEEFDMINKEYPCQIVADRAIGDIFREKYVDKHDVIIEGWNVSIHNIKWKMNKIEKKALEIINRKNPEITSIPDIFGIENGKYYHMVIDYPGKRYKQFLNIKSEEEFVKYIVKETINEIRNERK